MDMNYFAKKVHDASDDDWSMRSRRDAITLKAVRIRDAVSKIIDHTVASCEDRMEEEAALYANEALIELLDLCQGVQSWPQGAVLKYIEDKEAELSEEQTHS